MNVPALNGLDYVLIAIVLVSALIGILRGVVREIISLAAWVIGIWAAWHYGTALADFGARYLANAGLRLWVARVVIVIGVLVAGALLAWLVSLLLRGTGLSGLDRLLGMAFGIARGALIIAAVAWALRAAGLEHEPWWRESKLIPYAAPVLEELRALMQE
jgi:membrane protein required for colicin V production